MQTTFWRMNLHIDLWNQSHVDSDFSSLNVLVRKREFGILYQEGSLWGEKTSRRNLSFKPRYYDLSTQCTGEAGSVFCVLLT